MAPYYTKEKVHTWLASMTLPSVSKCFANFSFHHISFYILHSQHWYFLLLSKNHVSTSFWNSFPSLFKPPLKCYDFSQVSHGYLESFFSKPPVTLCTSVYYLTPWVNNTCICHLYKMWTFPGKGNSA